MLDIHREAIISDSFFPPKYRHIFIPREKHEHVRGEIKSKDYILFLQTLKSICLF